jgi:hypothetical protein
MTLEEFKTANPDYADMPDGVLADKLYMKFYSDRITRSEFMKAITPKTDPSKIGVQGVLGGIAERWNDKSTSQFKDPSFIRLVRDLIYEPLIGGQELTEDAFKGGKNLDVDYPPVRAVVNAAGVPTAGGALLTAGRPLAGAARGAAGPAAGVAGGRLAPTPDSILSDQPAKIVLDALPKTQRTPEALQALEQQGLQFARSGADTISPLDLGGKELENIAGVVHRSGGEAAEIMERHLAGRAEGQQGRLEAGLTRNLADPNIAYKKSDEIFEEATKESGPAYKEAYEHPLDVAHPQYNAILNILENTRAGQQALGKATELFENAWRPGQPIPPRVIKDPDTKKLRFATPPNTEQLDVVLRGLDDVVDANKIPGELGAKPKLTAVGSSVQGVKRDVRSALFGLNPKFQDARTRWATKAEIRDAIEEGMDALTKPAEEIARHLRDKSEAYKEHYRIGVADALRRKIGRADSADVDRTRGMLSPNFVKQLQAVFPDDYHMRPQGQGYEHVMRLLQGERLQAVKKNVIARGSQSADRLAAGGRSALEGLEGNIERVREGLKNPITAMAREGLDWWLKNKWGLNDPKKAADVARLLTQRAGDPVAFRAMWDRLEKQIKREK